MFEEAEKSLKKVEESGEDLKDFSNKVIDSINKRHEEFKEIIKGKIEQIRWYEPSTIFSSLSDSKNSKELDEIDKDLTDLLKRSFDKEKSLKPISSSSNSDTKRKNL